MKAQSNLLLLLLFGMGQPWAVSLSTSQFACGVARAGDLCLTWHRDTDRGRFQYSCRHVQIDDGQEKTVLLLGSLSATGK